MNGELVSAWRVIVLALVINLQADITRRYAGALKMIALFLAGCALVMALKGVLAPRPQAGLTFQGGPGTGARGCEMPPTTEAGVWYHLRIHITDDGFRCYVEPVSWATPTTP